MSKWLAYRIGDDDQEESLVIVRAEAEWEAREIAERQLALVGLARVWAENGKAIRQMPDDEHDVDDRRPVRVVDIQRAMDRLDATRGTIAWLAGRAQACHQFGTLSELDSAGTALSDAIRDPAAAIKQCEIDTKEP